MYLQYLKFSGLWTKMQEEVINPSDELLLKLATFLKSKNMEVPFVVPSVTSERVSPTKRQNQASSTTSERTQQIKPKEVK